MQVIRKLFYTQYTGLEGGQGVSPSYPISNAFDGNTSTYVRGAGVNATEDIVLTFQFGVPTSPFPEFTKVELYSPGVVTEQGNVTTTQASINYGTVISLTADTWVEITGFSGRINRIQLLGVAANSPRLAAIRGTLADGSTYIVTDGQDVNNGTSMHTITVVENQPQAWNQSSKFKPTTNAAFINPIWSSQTRASSNVATVASFSMAGLTRAIRWPLQGRRPAYGLKFPRGYYNK